MIRQRFEEALEREVGEAPGGLGERADKEGGRTGAGSGQGRRRKVRIK